MSGTAQAHSQYFVIQRRQRFKGVEPIHEQDFRFIDITDTGHELLIHQRLSEWQMVMRAQSGDGSVLVKCVCQ
ncbi:MAG: hypothetical protein CMQ69_06560 [Gammaproteobacteria bacterium]|nr:hypothetical protein [Gammaproteobacteria bacterium]